MKKIVNIDVNALKESIDSHKTGVAIKFLKESILKFGIQQPIIIDENNVILAGNAVYKAAIDCGIKSLPCIKLSNLSDSEKRKYRIVDNKTGEFAQWNEEKLNKELSYLQNIEDIQFCFDEDLMNRLNPFSSSKEKKNIDNFDTCVENVNEKFLSRINTEEEKIKPKNEKYFSYICKCCGEKVTIKI